MKLSRRTLLSSAAFAATGAAAPAFLRRPANAAEFTYKCGASLPDGHPMAIRAREAETGSRTLIVALTAYAMTGDRERCLAAGMDAYLSKPLLFPELERVLEDLTPAHAPMEAGTHVAALGD